MFVHCWFTFGLFSKMRLTVVPSFWAIEVHVSPATTVYVSVQSWPMMARHSSCQTRQSLARGRRVRVRGGRTSPGTRLEQSALITPAFAFWSWNLRTRRPPARTGVSLRGGGSERGEN